MVLHVSPDVFQVLRPLHAATRERLILLLSQRGRESFGQWAAAANEIQMCS